MSLSSRLKRLEIAERAYWDRQIQEALRLVQARVEAGDRHMIAAVERAKAFTTCEEGLAAVDDVLALLDGEDRVHPATEAVVRDRLQQLAGEVRAMSDEELLAVIGKSTNGDDNHE